MRRCLLLLTFVAPAWGQAVDFNRDVRPILSNNCFACHGPDEQEREGKLRLDTRDGAHAAAVVAGKPEASELIARLITADRSELMPPAKTGKTLSAAEIDTLKRWVKQGGNYAVHWAYVKPTRPDLPTVKDAKWSRTPVDRFLLARLEKEGLTPSPEADRLALARRLSLDLTGLPPTVAEAEAFAKNTTPDAYEKYVDALMRKPAYGEHWARLWLDLARYADSAGYADDPKRTIWAYRDYVIKSLNANKPFDQFTIEQLAGDLLPKPTDDQLIATAFHRNTMTNSEGGTVDEEFRNVAVVDRVNTTLTTWMGVSIACAQCHTHKYDPITQSEYFALFAILNNTADADRNDETPLHRFFGDEQRKRRAAWDAEVAAIEARLTKAAQAGAVPGLAEWVKSLQGTSPWAHGTPTATSKSGAKFTVDGHRLFVAQNVAATDTYTVEMPLDAKRLTGLRLEALADDRLPGKGPGHGGGNFVVTRLTAKLVPPATAKPVGRYVRITLPGAQPLSLAEVQVFQGTTNIALKGEAKQSTTAFEGPAKLAIDGNTDGVYANKSVTHTFQDKDPWWELDLKTPQAIDRIAVWNRLDNVEARLAGYRVDILNEKREVVWTTTNPVAPKPSATHDAGGARDVAFTSATADYEQQGFPATAVIAAKANPSTGWAVGGSHGLDHALSLFPATGIDVPAGSKLAVTIEMKSTYANHTLGAFRLAVTDDANAATVGKLPAAVRSAITAAKREPAQDLVIADHFVRNVAAETKADRDRLAALTKMLADDKGVTVPVLEELKGTARRKTRLQHRGNYKDLGDEIKEGVPAVFPKIDAATPTRLDLARWLVSPENPLTARVTVNRFWEHLFGTGLVRTSEEFGIQGELPSHPELLDWLATELIRLNWDTKALVKLLVTSAAYRQSTKVSKELVERDPENRLLARGPRLRLTAEMVRDQALMAGGLLSSKMHGPSVKPPQPALGISAAFGGSIDWQTSAGEDRHRRGLYTEWRRSNPYPAMSTFDAPNRDICVVRRSSTNTPLQALVTLNDIVYLETAQGLARRAVKEATSPEERATFAFRQALIRMPTKDEVARLVKLYEDAKSALSKDIPKATQLATNPFGPMPAGVEVAELAAWTTVANVILNLDETLMKR